ncbi:STAS domain-containing protein [Streptomyces sp. GC420]|uniref:STAS domain-containing protein n=1 Tax=Streptomyces sp. GC420 TaxID=2697568 RepID=UPI0014150999|nr:STAS domain-containing protein [Streptomyces sp. GC420]NBM16800.1 hypothetical protein [Streptomyces sp. GC420]
MDLSHYQVADRLVVEVTDVIDIANDHEVGSCLRGLLDRRGTSELVVDLHGCIVTATGLRVLLQTQRVARARGLAMCAVAAHPLARKVFRITHLHDSIPLYPSVAEALRDVTRDLDLHCG